MSMDRTVAAIIVKDLERAFNIMLLNTDERLEELRRALGVKPDVVAAEKAALAAARTIDSFVEATARLEALLCKPTSPRIVETIKQRVTTLKELHAEVVMCKALTAVGDARPRNHKVEN